MNDEELVSKTDADKDVPTGDPLPPENAPSGDFHIQAPVCNDTDGSEEAMGEMESDSAVSDDPVQDPDPAASTPAAEAPEDQLEQLRGELSLLRAQIAARDAAWERMGKECEEFQELYPETSLSSLPDAVWEDVRRGIPIAAAYALMERKKGLTAQKAAACNQSNTLRSAGAISPTESEYFSPSEVRAMTQTEVRANYQKIKRSMQKWH